MRSMTGYGRGVAAAGGTRATVDVRAVNHRFLDLKLRGALLSPSLEEAVSNRVRAALERGSVAVSVHLAREQGGSGMRIDAGAAERAYHQLAELAARLALGKPDLALVLAQPGVVVVDEDRGDDSEPPVLEALDGALAQLAAMRDTEGRALAAELTARLDELAALRTTVAALAGAVPGRLAARHHERLRRLLDDAELQRADPARLAQEVALLADRADVTEELVRLASHLDQVRALIATPKDKGAVGRRLDFLVQEIGRELNTIGSKSAVAEISTAVVEGKAVLEKVREQVQNVE
ncbi:MAG: YicC family protein [Deltaproteobacteria bacterium]|nr:YicC family protein [Deltaproteobacteria bacterium]